MEYPDNSKVIPLLLQHMPEVRLFWNSFCGMESPNHIGTCLHKALHFSISKTTGTTVAHLDIKTLFKGRKPYGYELASDRLTATITPNFPHSATIF